MLCDHYALISQERKPTAFQRLNIQPGQNHITGSMAIQCPLNVCLVTVSVQATLFFLIVGLGHIVVLIGVVLVPLHIVPVYQ